MTDKVNSYIFEYKNEKYSKEDIERLIDSETLFCSQIELHRRDRAKLIAEISELKDKIAILTHRKE